MKIYWASLLAGKKSPPTAAGNAEKTKALNKAVKRNGDRFPKDFAFQLTKEEWKALRSQTVTSDRRRVSRSDYLGRETPNPPLQLPSRPYRLQRKRRAAPSGACLLQRLCLCPRRELAHLRRAPRRSPVGSLGAPPHSVRGGATPLMLPIVLS